jgi:hypothetical protein
MDYKLADRLVANGLQCGCDCFPLAGIEVALGAFTFDFPRSIGRKWTVLDAIRVLLFTRPPASRPGVKGIESVRIDGTRATHAAAGGQEKMQNGPFSDVRFSPPWQRSA